MNIAAFLAFSLGITILTAQEAATNSAPLKIAAAEAKNYIGTNSVVTGVIAEVNKAERLVRLNFDKPFPKHTFTAVVFSSSTNRFADFDKLQGKTVEVSGKITEYRDRPQIVLNSTNQLKVIEKEVKEPAERK